MTFIVNAKYCSKYSQSNWPKLVPCSTQLNLPGNKLMLS